MLLIYRVLFANFVVCLSALWVRFSFAKLKPGLPRLAAALPVLAVNLLLPALCFDRLREFVTRGSYLLLLTWLANFKMLGYVLERGPLCLPLTCTQFCLIYALPITPQVNEQGSIRKVKSNSRLSHSAGSKSTLLTKFIIKLALLFGIIYVLTTYELPVLLAEFAKAFCLYWFLGVLMDGPAAVIGYLAQLPISPHFDAPYLSSSISEFWSKRWNLTVGNALRFLVYDPIHEGRLVKSDEAYNPVKMRSFAALCWTFIVSGLMHELIMAFLEPEAVTGQWLAFFALQAPLVAVESLLLKQAKQHNLRPPPWLAVPVTICLLLLMGHLFFFQPVVNSGLDDRFFESMTEATRILI